MSDRPAVAFVGTGVMGASMADHLLDAGYPLVVFNRTTAKAQSLLDRGARWAATAGDAAAQADITITMVGYPYDVEEVYLGSGGIIERAPGGALLIDMTTSTPTLALRIAEAALARGLSALDAPVSGGDVGARNATLTIMAGGSEGAFARALPLFEVMGKTQTLMGGPGAGQHTKMANQIGIAGTMLGLIEALEYAKAAGLLFRDGRNIEVKDGVAFVDGVPIADAVKEWAGADGAVFKAAGQATGGGAPGGGKSVSKTRAEMGDAERLELARQGKL